MNKCKLNWCPLGHLFSCINNLILIHERGVTMPRKIKNVSIIYPDKPEKNISKYEKLVAKSISKRLNKTKVALLLKILSNQ